MPMSVTAELELPRSNRRMRQTTTEPIPLPSSQLLDTRTQPCLGTHPPMILRPAPGCRASRHPHAGRRREFVVGSANMPWTFVLLALVFMAVGQAASQVGGDVRMLNVTGEGAKYWSRWRGPSGQGLATPGKYANFWSPSRNIKWRVAVPGAGNSSPIVWADRIYLTTAQNNGAKLSLLAFSRADGKLLWESVVPQQGIEHVHQKNGHASATPVTNGQMIYA